VLNFYSIYAYEIFCRYVAKSGVDNVMLPSTEISGGLGSEPMFCVFLFGEEILSPRCEADSLKLFSDVVASVADGRSKAVSSA